MNLEVDMSSLQSLQVEEQASHFITDLVRGLLQRSDLFSLRFEIERLKFGTSAPSVRLLSMSDVDVTLQWHLITHDLHLPALRRTLFQAPFQCVLSLDWDSDLSLALNASISLDSPSISCVSFPVKASVSRPSLSGALTIQYLGDSVVLFFESAPRLSFDLEVILGAEEKLFDQHQIRDFALEALSEWIASHAVHPHALRLPLIDDGDAPPAE